LAEALASDRLDRAINGWAKLRLAKPQKLGGPQGISKTRRVDVFSISLSQLCNFHDSVL
jgi:hypothetical protein